MLNIRFKLFLGLLLLASPALAWTHGVPWVLTGATYDFDFVNDVAGGSTQNWMDGLQNYGSTATQATQTYAEQQAHSQRSAQRTAMRMASSDESTTVTTKTITNHNKLHALTMQYFEVLRQFDITTAYDGVSLVCLVPLDLVWFLPPGQKEQALS